MEAIAHLKNISLSYHSPQGETKALDNVTFDIYDGEFLSIVGPSGCGKSTLLSVISGLSKPSEGTVKIAGNRKALICCKKTIFLNGEVSFQMPVLVLNFKKILQPKIGKKSMSF